MVEFTGLDGYANHFPNCLEHLVVAPAIAAIGQGLLAAAE